MEKITINKEIFNEYIKERTTTLNTNNGFFIQDKNIFIVSIKIDHAKQLKNRLINRRCEILEEYEKITSKETNAKSVYFLIDCKNKGARLSAKALFKKYVLIARKKRVLSPTYRQKYFK